MLITYFIIGIIVLTLTILTGMVIDLEITKSYFRISAFWVGVITCVFIWPLWLVWVVCVLLRPFLKKD